jgi:hypothetical protein
MTPVDGFPTLAATLAMRGCCRLRGEHVALGLWNAPAWNNARNLSRSCNELRPQRTALEAEGIP